MEWNLKHGFKRVSNLETANKGHSWYAIDLCKITVIISSIGSYDIGHNFILVKEPLPLALLFCTQKIQRHSFRGEEEVSTQRTRPSKTTNYSQLAIYNQMNAQNNSLTNLQTNTPMTKSHLGLLQEPSQKQITCKIPWPSSNPYVQRESYTDSW